ncbi:MAG: hypothetical protein Q9162_004024 [Coniocarpon cinnabarinum]
MDHAFRGQSALDKSDFSAAVENYTLALQSSPESPAYYIKRSTAYQRNSQPDLALADSEKAVLLATKRAKRELIAQAQSRRGIAYFQSGQFGNARFCLQIAKKLDNKDKSIDIWIAKCDGKLKTVEDNDEAAKVTIQDLPDEQSEKPSTPQAACTESYTAITSLPNNASATPTPSSQPQTPKQKVRHEWYQNSEFVTINLLAKGVPKDQATIDIQPQSLSISYPIQSESTFDFVLEPLFASVDTEGSRSRVLSTKIEITLKKGVIGQRWASLEGTEVTAPGVSNEYQNEKPGSSVPSYPTSSRTGPKNWDQIAQSYQKPSEKSGPSGAQGEEGQENGDQDDMYLDDYEDGGDPANAFFKKLYAGADPDTKRAMMKSYQESGGTALSTDWSEVSKRKVEVSPPEGMEEKKWEQ